MAAFPLEQAWHLLGMTMISFLALGTGVLVLGGIVRVALKRSNPRVRYAASLTTLVVLAILPLAIASRFTFTTVHYVQLEVAEPTRTAELPTVMVRKTAEAPRREAETTNGTIREPEFVDLFSAPTKHFSPAEMLFAVLEYLPWLWIVGTPLTFLLLASGLIGAERLRSASQLLTSGPLHDSCERLRTTLGIGREVGIAICDRVATPLLVGVVRPLILLPPSALLGWPPEQLEMVILHELAHVRRWDNAVNLAQRIVESVLFFHPAVWIVSGWVRRDREDCCDAVVVAHTAKPQAYAELLVALAANQPLAGLAASAFARHPLASRIRRILKLEDEPMLVSRKGLMMGASAVMAVVLCVVFLTKSEAEEASPVTNKSSRERPEVTTKHTNDTKKDLTTEDTESTREKNAGKKPKPAYRIVYPLGENEGQAEELLEAVGGLSEAAVITKDGKKMVVVGADEAGHNKFRELLDRTRGKSSGSLFPTLEEQKAADFAYKLLGVELEKLDPEELDRVKINGYAGGLRVTTIDSPMHGLRNDDLLVGLHAWPTESLEQIEEILSREDLEELSPLKFYVIRRVVVEPRKATIQNTNQVVTGRVHLQLAEWKENRQRQQIANHSYTLRPNDVINIVANQGEEGDAENLIDDAYSVDEDGTVNLGPPYGKVLLANLPIADVGEQIQEHLPQSPRCQVEITLLKPEAEGKQRETHTRLQLDSLKKQILKELVGKENERNTIGNERTPERAMLDSEIEQLQEILNTLERRLYKPTASEQGMNSNTSLVPLYDGKTFEEWRNNWKTELKTEKRTECIKALAAFGRTGQGKEAAEAILDVAGEYDFYMMDGSAEGKLKKSVIDSLTSTEHARLPERDWLSSLVERLDAKPEKYHWLAWNLLANLKNPDPSIKPILLELLKNDESNIREIALSHLFYSPQMLSDAEQAALLQTSLLQHPAEALRVSGSRLLDYIAEEQVIELLLSEQQDVQIATRNATRWLKDQVKATHLAKKLLAILNDQARQKDHLAMIRALAAIGEPGIAAEPALTQIIESTDREELMIAAAYAREMITLQEGGSRNIQWGSATDETKNAILKANRWPDYTKDESHLTKAIKAEATRVTGEKATEYQNDGGGMGGGGMSGGGMF